MYMALSPGAIGMKPNGLTEAIALAKDNGFAGVEVNISEVADLIDSHGAGHVNGLFTEVGIKPAGWGMPVDWRGEEAKWQAGLETLPRLAAAAKAIGCTRTMTWVMPCSNDRDFDANRKFHIERFKPIAAILAAHDCRFGLEFIGPKTLRETQKYPFIHTMQAMLEMDAEIGPNMGLLLDCFHWYTSGATVDDLLELTPDDVVYVHVNDARFGIAPDEQLDGKRALPGATGVIDIQGFLTALQKIGYEGPVTPEPFGNAASWTAQAMQGIFRLAGLA